MLLQKLDQESRRTYSLSGRVNRGCTTHLENGKIGLEQTGFTLTNNRTQCSNFRDEELISSVYLPEMQDLICRLTGAKAAYHYGF